MIFSKVAPSLCHLQKKKLRQQEAQHTWHMKDGITLWNVDPLYPKPFSPVHRALKFSGGVKEKRSAGPGLRAEATAGSSQHPLYPPTPQDMERPLPRVLC